MGADTFLQAYQFAVALLFGTLWGVVFAIVRAPRKLTENGVYCLVSDTLCTCLGGLFLWLSARIACDGAITFHQVLALFCGLLAVRACASRVKNFAEKMLEKRRDKMQAKAAKEGAK